MVSLLVAVNSKEQVVNLVNSLSKLDYNVNACIGYYVLDAKSILGMLGIGIGRKIMLKAYTEDIDSL